MKPIALLTTIPSDSHSWNLIFMELVLKEIGYEVINLGVCTPYNLTTKSINLYTPNIIVVSTINGHGYIEGEKLIKKVIKKCIHKCPIYIGGKLSTNTEKQINQIDILEKKGYTKAFMGNDFSIFKKIAKKICVYSMT